MAEAQNPQSDKNRKARPFGSFLLFLTVLVLVLVAFGGDHFKPRERFTQDRFEWELNTGNVAKLVLKGDEEIQGALVSDGRAFQVSYPDVAELAAPFRELAAIGAYTRLSVVEFNEAVAKGWYEPDTLRHLTAYRRAPRGAVLGPGASSPDEPPQEDRVFAGVTAKSRGAWEAEQGPESSDPYHLPERSGSLWLELVDVQDLASLKSAVKARGAVVETQSYQLGDEFGTTHGKASATMTDLLLLWGPWILIFGVFLLFMRQMRQQGSGAGVMSFGRSRAQLYSKESHTNVTFDDVAGADEAKDEVHEVVEFLKNPGRFTRIGGRIPRGVLLIGSPGCGKTLLAKAIAGEAEVPFFSISGSDFVEMFVGVGASRVRDLFKQARENSPCIIFLDEIDAVGRRRGSGMGGGHDEREQTLNAILVEMDGFGTDEGIIVVAATNRPDVLDPALLRPGRFDREVVIDLPDLAGRHEILKVHLKKVKVGDDVDVETLARSTPGYSGADLAAIVNEAAIMAVLDKKDSIAMRHLEEAAAKVRYGRQKKSRKIEEDDRRITAYHEAGHTIVAAKVDEVDMPHKVTIVPRGRALGATMMLPEKESYHMQKRRLLGQLAMAFGGRVAEEVFCGDISAGAADDIKRATELARAMVTELGMSEKIGPINYAERQGSDFLGTELLSGKWHSEETARLIDEEIERILREAYEAAKAIVTRERDSIERLTEALLEFETINAQEIRRLIGGAPASDLRPPKPKKVPRNPIPAPPQPAEAETESHPGGKELPGDLSGEPGFSPA